ncbi:MAG: polysaccharide export protein [candidate division KSB1 bacterium]|nr:polysaccharide export protein [candidate division KSB1 bacterium]MDZ7302300.1 polysaccharide export protein [candidate division KSB1 bacterium]MDZ7311406.1 polysaccharide export protein [candidate division KSB1 bacterium]
MRMKLAAYLLSWILCWGFWGLASAQEYILEPRDVISISFWQQPDLNVQMARIDAEGKINIPLVGRITAAGLTISQLSSRIVERISIYNKSITQATIVINEYGSKKIFITGAVGAPGKYSFEKMPTLWEAILEAGGPQQNAQLGNVQLIRGGAESGKIIEVDLAGAFEKGDMRELPALMPGDNIYVPPTPPTGAGGAAAGGARGGIAAAGGLGNLAATNKLIYVFGHVMAPGVYPIEKNVDVLQAIVLAGGPAYPNRATVSGPIMEPDLARVKIISRGPDAPVVYSVNVEKYTNTATPVPLILKPGDTVYIPAKQSYRRFLLTTSVSEVIRASVAVITSYLLLNQLFGQGK